MTLEGADHVLLLEDELVEHLCPLHADLEIGDLTKCTVYELAWLEIACKDLRFHEEQARYAQVQLIDRDPRSDRAAFFRQQLRLIASRGERIRAEMRRTIARRPVPAPIDGPDLWARP